MLCSVAHFLCHDATTEIATLSLHDALPISWSKTIDIGADEWFGTGTNGTSVQDPYHLQRDKSLAGFDLPQIFTGDVVYELPFGKGRRFMSGLRSVDALIGTEAGHESPAFAE